MVVVVVVVVVVMLMVIVVMAAAVIVPACTRARKGAIRHVQTDTENETVTGQFQHVRPVYDFQLAAAERQGKNSDHNNRNDGLGYGDDAAH